MQDFKRAIEKYVYNQSNILRGDLKIYRDVETQTITLDPWYQFGNLTNSGTCAELMSKAYQDLRTSFPDHHFFRANGREPQYFNVPGAHHCFLFASPKNFMGDQRVTRNADEIARYLEHDPLLIDPSFGVVTPFSHSNYTVDQLVNTGCPISYWKRQKVPFGCITPLGVARSKKLVYLEATAWSRSIAFSMQRPGSEHTEKFLHDSLDLDHRLRSDPLLTAMVNKIRDAPVIEGANQRIEPVAEFVV